MFVDTPSAYSASAPSVTLIRHRWWRRRYNNDIVNARIQRMTDRRYPADRAAQGLRRHFTNARAGNDKRIDAVRHLPRSISPGCRFTIALRLCQRQFRSCRLAKFAQW